MKIKLLALSLLAFYISSCGPSEAEIQAREKFLIDSIQRVQFIEDSISDVMAQNARIEAQKKEQERLHQERVKIGSQIKKEKLESYIVQLNDQLKKEKKKYMELSEFKLLRSSSDKKRQLDKQQEVISEIEVVIAAIENELTLVSGVESFPFQDTPEGTVTYLFTAAKNGEYSKLRYLLDPYGEFDNDVFGLCLTGSMPKQVKERYVDDFSNGRVIGSPTFSDSISEVEFAFGYSSNQLEKMSLVNRMGKWYLLSF